MARPSPSKVRIVIVGTGFAGLCMTAKLLEAGIDDFVLLEKADEVGGTWRENTYPGAECDIPSALYSFSFAQNPMWDFKWAKQKQIFGYLKDFATTRGLRPHIQFGKCVTEAHYDDITARWSVKTDDGHHYDCQFFVTAIGQLHHPNTPKFTGQSTFKGPQFHSAQWDHSIDLTGKSVAVIGNAASAIQLIPEIAKSVKTLSVYQRSANWIIPKFDRPYSRLEKALSKRFPALTNLYRGAIWCQGEYVVYPTIQGKPLRSKLLAWTCRQAIKKSISDPEMRRALTPTYPIGAKRILLNDSYYPTLAEPHVDLITAPIKSFNAKGITTTDGQARHHEVIIYATGFKSNPFLMALDIKGQNGLSIRDHWRDGAFAYNGVMTSGFPNMFMLYGPNTNTGHTSIVYKLEIQVAYILQLIAKTKSQQITVKETAEDTFNTEIQNRLKSLAWDQIDASWYKDGTRITNNWPGSGREFKKRLSAPLWADFEIT